MADQSQYPRDPRTLDAKALGALVDGIQHSSGLCGQLCSELDALAVQFEAALASGDEERQRVLIIQFAAVTREHERFECPPCAPPI